jgi:hypothetical protein
MAGASAVGGAGAIREFRECVCGSSWVGIAIRSPLNGFDPKGNSLAIPGQYAANYGKTHPARFTPTSSLPSAKSQ